MRVLEADLEAALNANAEPYLQLQYCIDDGFTWLDSPYPMFSFKLGDMELNVKTAGTAIFNAYAIRLRRGAYAHGIPHYTTSSTYYVNSKTVTLKQQIEIEASIIPKGTWRKYSVNGNQTYKQIIDAICTYFGYTAAYESPASAIWSNIFFPAGRTLVLQSPHSIFTLLRQKLFIYALDNNDNDIYFRQWLDDGLVGTGGHPSLETITTFDWKTLYSLQYRLLMWRDEVMSIHYYPDPTWYPNLPYYNLGYLESTASTPTNWQSWHENEDKRTFHLKYQDGDIIHCSSGTYQIQAIEIFNRKESPSLYLQFKALRKFSTTEGGPMPGTIEQSGPYTPLNVSMFNKNLNSTVNNLQAFADAVDELTTGPAMYAGATKDPLVDADEFPIIDSETTTHLIRKFTWANLKARVFAAFGPAVAATADITTPADDDLVPIVDISPADKPTVKLSWANLKAALKTYFDTQYVISYPLALSMTTINVWYNLGVNPAAGRSIHVGASNGYNEGCNVDLTLYYYGTDLYIKGTLDAALEFRFSAGNVQVRNIVRGGVQLWGSILK